MRNFCPKYRSFVVVVPPQGNSILSAWHLPKAALTQRAKSQDKGYQASSLLPQWNKPQESVALLLYMLQHIMSSSDLHGSGCKASFTASGVPIVSASLKTALILILSALGDKTAQNVHLGKKLVLTASDSLSKAQIGNLPARWVIILSSKRNINFKRDFFYH